MGMINYAKYKKLKTSIYEMIKDVQNPAVKAVMADAVIESLITSGELTESEVLESHDVCGFVLMCSEYGPEVVEDAQLWSQILTEDALMMEHRELSDGILLKKLSENPTLFIK